MKLIEKKIEDLNVDWNTVRRHPPAQIEKLAQSVKQFGMVKPIVVGSGNQVLAGAGILEALASIEVETVYCVDASKLSESQQRAFILADNMLAELSDWDMEAVEAILKTFDEDMLRETGFDDSELQAFELSGKSPDAPANDGPRKSAEGYTSIEFTIPKTMRPTLREKLRAIRGAMELSSDNEAFAYMVKTYEG